MRSQKNDGPLENVPISKRIINTLVRWVTCMYTDWRTEMAPVVVDDPPQLPHANETINDSGFFDFLDNVLLGKHEELLREMNRDILKEEEEEEEEEEGGPQQKLIIPLPQSRAYTASSAARSLKEFELIAYLGSGSFAEVTLARSRATQEHYALKKISKSVVEEEGCVERTFTERQLLASLRHPFLVDLYKAFQSPSHLYLLLEFAQGGDFYYFLEKKPWVRDMQRKLIRQAHRWDSRCEGRMAASLLSSHRAFRGRYVGGSEDEIANRIALTDMRGCEGRGAGMPRSARTMRQCERSGESVLFSSIMQSNSDAPLGALRHLPQLAPNESRMPIRLIAFYAVEIALVLEYIHDQGFVYRDLKPENVLMKRTGHVLLTDFGVAKYSGRSMQRKKEGQNTFTGTPQYMSPEMHLGEPHDFRTDWWSFGCILFEMTNGRRPFQGGNPFAVIQSIVEEDVKLHPSDFMLTVLEIETRVAQLHQQYVECCQYIRQLQDEQPKQRAESRVAKNISALNDAHLTNTPRDEICGDLGAFSMTSEMKPVPSTPPKVIDTSAHQKKKGDVLFVDSIAAGVTTTEAEVAISASGEVDEGGEKGTAAMRSGYSDTNDKSVKEAQRPMSSEERDMYVRHVVDELNEARTLLQDLILSLLQRNKERRISGPSVLEHSFFKCPYVASQLYHTCQTDNENITATTMSCDSAVGSHGPSIRHLVETSPSIRVLGSRAMRCVSPRSEKKMGRNADGTALGLSPKSIEIPESLAGVLFDVKRFLSLPRSTRPEGWRSFFLNDTVVPLYAPRLLAPDDLRYFPLAVTATGDSVMEQQRVLRRMGHRRVLSAECSSALHSSRTHHSATRRKDEADEESLPGFADGMDLSTHSNPHASTPFLEARMSATGAEHGDIMEDFSLLHTPVHGAVRSRNLVSDTEDIREEECNRPLGEYKRSIRNRMLEEHGHGYGYEQMRMGTEDVNDNGRDSVSEDNDHRNIQLNKKTLDVSGATHHGAHLLDEGAAARMKIEHVSPKVTWVLEETAEAAALTPKTYSALNSSCDDDKSGDHKKRNPSLRDARHEQCSSEDRALSYAVSMDTDDDDDESAGSATAPIHFFDAVEMPPATLHGIAYSVDDHFIPRNESPQPPPQPQPLSALADERAAADWASGGDGAQHYLGFTFDRRSGHALLQGADGGNEGVSFADLMR